MTNVVVTGTIDVVVLQPPSPPFADIDREFFGGMGLGSAVARPTWGHSRPPFFNHSLLWTAGTLLAGGRTVAFLDAQSERWDDRQTVDAVRSADPSVVLMLVNLPSLESDLELISALRVVVPGARTIVTGAVTRVLTERVAEHPAVDFVVWGEPEFVLPRLLDVLEYGGDIERVAGIAYRDGEHLVVTEDPGFPDDLDAIANTPYELVDLDRYRGMYFGVGQRVAPIVGSKGCPFACGYYCPYPTAYGTRVRHRDPVLVAAEMTMLYRHHGVQHFIMRDQNFTLNADWVRALCRALLAEHLDSIHWVCETRLRLAHDHELLALMRAAGCDQINFGLETGDKEAFESLGKPGGEFDRIADAVRAARKAGLRTHAHALIGLPTETWGTVRATSRLLKQCGFDSVNFSFLVPVPGTQFARDAEERGLVDSHDLAAYTHSQSVVRSETMPRWQLKLAQLYLSNRHGGFTLHRGVARRLTRGVSRVNGALRSTGRRPGVLMSPPEKVG